MLDASCIHSRSNQEHTRIVFHPKARAFVRAIAGARTLLARLLPQTAIRRPRLSVRHIIDFKFVFFFLEVAIKRRSPLDKVVGTAPRYGCRRRDGRLSACISRRAKPGDAMWGRGGEGTATDFQLGSLGWPKSQRSLRTFVAPDWRCRELKSLFANSLHLDLWLYIGLLLSWGSIT